MITTQEIDTNKIEECNLLCKLKMIYNKEASYRIHKKDTEIVIYYEGENNVLYKEDYYKLEKIVIHTPSIHVVDGSRHNMEISLHHSASLYKPITSNKLIVSFFADVSDESSSSDQFFKYFVDEIPSSGKRRVSFSKDFNIINILPNKKSFFIYEKDETKVLLFSEPISILDDYIQKIKEKVNMKESETYIDDDNIVYFNNNEEIEIINPDDIVKNKSKNLYIKCKRVPKKRIEVSEAPSNLMAVQPTTNTTVSPKVEISDSAIRKFKTIMSIITLLLCVLLALLFVKLINRGNYLNTLNSGLGTLHNKIKHIMDRIKNVIGGFFKINRNIVPRE